MIVSDNKIFNSSDIICFNQTPVNGVSFLAPNVPYRLVENMPTMRQTIKGTDYIITGRFSLDAKETALEKMRRIILNAPMEN